MIWRKFLVNKSSPELQELKEWVCAETPPTTEPQFLSTKMYRAEHKRYRQALECALDYVKHMAPEDAKLIRAAYNNEPFELKRKPIQAIDDRLVQKLRVLHPKLEDPYASRVYCLLEMYRKHNSLVMPLHEIESRILGDILDHAEKEALS